MLFGAPLWYGNRPFKHFIEQVLALGFDFLEIALDYPVVEEASSELKRDVNRTSARVAFHGPLDALIASPRSEIFEASLKVLEKCMSFAGEFETLYFNMHATHLTPTFRFKRVKQKINSNLKRALKVASQLAREYGFEFCLENNGIVDRSVIEEFDICVTLDVGHAAVNAYRSQKDYRTELLRHARRYQGLIKVVHAHDFSLKAQRDHLPLGAGDLDLDLLSRLVRKASPKYLVLEVFWKSCTRASPAGTVELEESLKLLAKLVKF